MVRKNTAEAKAEASKRDEVKARIVAEALEAVENALLSDRITTLDTMLFGTMKLALSTAGPISFHPIDWTNTSPDMRKLITTRLKLCGYKYSGADQVWRQQEPKPFVKLKEWVHIPADHEHQFRFNVNTISGPM
ncbi:hypothetical protein [Aeromonas sp. QDB68]|uniref:hypothetical protein n=2 Tax=unclassified Aeromonas TaxID=257493 RepID=UPI0022E8ACCF|nr:hypothetical protein [Aeromonas sp. QDB68]